jgi:hypothetical protein
MERFADSSRIIEDQEGVAARILFRQAYSHSVAIIFWAVDDPQQSEKPAIVGGSGVLVELKGIPYVVTCEHTIRSFQAMLATDPRYRFQIGGVVINLNERLKDREQTLDLAIIDVSGLDCAQLGLRDDYQLRPLVPTRWPPNPVARSGGLVVVCGFPGGPTREIDVKSHNIVSPGFNFVEHVSDVGADSFLVPFNRATWVTDRNARHSTTRNQRTRPWRSQWLSGFYNADNCRRPTCPRVTRYCVVGDTSWAGWCVRAFCKPDFRRRTDYSPHGIRRAWVLNFIRTDDDRIKRSAWSNQVS